jgi:hypothetical protein
LAKGSGCRIGNTSAVAPRFTRLVARFVTAAAQVGDGLKSQTTLSWRGA